jgi:hypothetical protein
MKLTRILLGLTIVATAMPALAQLAPEWKKTYGDPEGLRDDLPKIAVDPSGNTSVSLVAAYTDYGQDIVTVRYDPAGRQLWRKRWNNVKWNCNDAPDDVTCDAAGNTYVVGTTWNGLNETHWDGTKVGDGTEFDIVVIKYGPTGDLLWQRRYDDAIMWQDFGTRIRVDRSGNVFVAGDSMSRAAADHPVTPNWLNYDFVTLKFDPNGKLLWKRTWNDPQQLDDRLSDMVLDPDGNVYIAGRGARYDGGWQWDQVTIKYSADGKPLWVRSHRGTADMLPNAMIPRKMLLDAQGNVYVCVWDTGTNGRDLLLLKYTSAGGVAWKRNWRKDREDVAMDMVLDSKGNVIVACDSEPVISPGYQISDSLLLKFAPNGNLLWEQRYNGPDDNWDGDSQLEIDEFDNLYVGLQSQSIGYNYTVLKYAPQGVRKWVWRYDHPNSGSDAILGMVYGQDGLLRMTGTVQADGYLDVLTTALRVASVEPMVIPTVASISLASTTVNGASSTQLTVRLSAPAPEGGASVKLVNDCSYATTNMSVDIPKGATTGTVTVSTNYVPYQMQAHLKAVYNSTSKTAVLTIKP